MRLANGERAALPAPVALDDHEAHPYSSVRSSVKSPGAAGLIVIEPSLAFICPKMSTQTTRTVVVPIG